MDCPLVPHLPRSHATGEPNCLFSVPSALRLNGFRYPTYEREIPTGICHAFIRSNGRMGTGFLSRRMNTGIHPV